MIAPLAGLFGLLRGIHEGMVMHKPGVREHRWFRAYHAIAGLAYWSFAALVWLWRDKRPGWISSTGLALLIWEFTEAGYLIARPALGAYEHVAFFDIISFKLSCSAAIVWHGIRTAAAIALIIIGRKRDRRRQG